MTCASLFIALRESLEATQQEFAKTLGCSQALVSKIEKGHMGPNLEVFLEAYRAARGVGGNILDDFKQFMETKRS